MFFGTAKVITDDSFFGKARRDEVRRAEVGKVEFIARQGSIRNRGFHC